MAWNLRAAGVCIGAWLMVMASGCSKEFDYGPSGTVKGRLTLEGKPLSPQHAVSFMEMQKGFLAYGKTDADGNYTVTSWNEGRLPIGAYKVLIAPPPLEDTSKKERTPEEMFDHPEMEVNWKMEFPRKYRDTSTSGLEFQIKEGENVVDIDLKKTGK